MTTKNPNDDKTIDQLLDEAVDLASDAESEASSAEYSARRASELVQQARDRLAKPAPIDAFERDRNALIDALMEFAEAKGISRYPEGTLLHRLRVGVRP